MTVMDDALSSNCRQRHLPPGCKAVYTGGRVTLRVEADKEKYSFYYSVDGSSLKYLSSVSTRFVSTEIVGRCFTGTVIGLYAASISSSDSRMTVYDFSMR